MRSPTIARHLLEPTPWLATSLALWLLIGSGVSWLLPGDPGAYATLAKAALIAVYTAVFFVTAYLLRRSLVRTPERHATGSPR